MDIILNESWISGKYSCGVIDTSLGIVEHAWEIISEIHQIWLTGDLTTEQAFQQWISSNI